MNKDFKRGGLYWANNTPYLSVTEILKVINKPALQYWFGQEVYRAVIKDPMLDERTALGMPYRVSDNAKLRGQTVHSIVEAYKQTGAVLEGISEEYQGYATAFYQFMKDHNVIMVDQEKTVFDDQYRIAGTLDIYAQIGNTWHIIDVKTGKGIYQEASLQLSAYSHMLKGEGKEVDEVSVLLLETGLDGKPTGKYTFQVVKDGFEAFLAARTLYLWQEQERLIKLGYI